MTTEQVINTYAALDAEALNLLAPIQDEAAYEAALAALDGLMERMGQDETHPLRPLLELLAEHVEAYEDVHYALPDAPAHDRLSYLMDIHQLSQTELAAATGIAQSNISAVQRGKRDISKGMAQKLATYFGVPAAVFLD